MSGAQKPIYLDYQATTPVDSRVLEAMLPYFTEEFGNPASNSHIYGNRALRAVEDSRELLASVIGGKPQEVVFTSGATEAINLAIKGISTANHSKGRHFITAATEHKAVIDCFAWLDRNGFDTTILPVERSGLVSLDGLQEAIRPDTIMVSIMAANNEIGVIQPIQQIGEICRERGVYFMTDATQAFAFQSIDVQEAKVDMLVASSHKIYGPKAAGMLWLRRSNPRVTVEPLLHGGGHERGLRSGTLPVPNIVGFAKAAAYGSAERASVQKHQASLSSLLLTQLQSGIEGCTLNGDAVNRLPGNINVCLPGVDADAIIAALLNDLAISTGSACTSASVTSSHVLRAIGMSDSDARSSVRISIGRETKKGEVLTASSLIIEAYSRIRSLSVF